ncbi:STM4011 family radical SAM protein [Clostridium tetani]|uniref:Radical SAM protein n=1 Tax=Clostridium tetani TaxID=1513 RepID=A0ABY0ERC4_CLOTA|nr:STM4011 family radical SAM protein [Clostridium tetani]KHO32263.1 radical SAM protein [Clostridium tetani]RXI39781.1 radical SAM protein [Clostridium tetani]RXI57742.1 radical SAM protein [Clostridium tetani]CDI50746.1 putative HAD superfamily hydrolase [Clostridium tetani 12124569]
MTYTIIYRPSVKYCNYRCEYCPFSKYKLDQSKVEKDKKLFKKFINFIREGKSNFKIFIAPKGEILGFDYYKEGITYLSHLENVEEIVVQTNLSNSINWVDNVNKQKLKLWTTYHPNEAELNKFFNNVNKLSEKHITFSVGTVGIKENLHKIKELKLKIENIKNKKPYVWVNAYKDKKDYYSENDIDEIEKIDPYFEINIKNYKSNRLSCKTGESVFWVEGNGIIHRCYKDNVVLGNIYKDNLEDIKKSIACRNKICTCFIGYVNIYDLQLENIYKNSLMGRII